MFKRSEESEWRNFSKAFTGKEKEDMSGDEAAAVVASEAGESAVAAASPPMPTPSARFAPADTNLTVARGSTREGPLPTAYTIDDVESTIGEHTFFDGTYKSESSIRIRGTAKGEIECANAIFIEENAKVSARVTAASITVAGEVEGELTCSGKVELRPTGRVTGTINAGTLVMQEGAFFDGNLHMGGNTPASTTSTS